MMGGTPSWAVIGILAMPPDLSIVDKLARLKGPVISTSQRSPSGGSSSGPAP